jgi:hypothetical protein
MCNKTQKRRDMTSTEILSVVLGVISLFLGGMGCFLFYYFENIKPVRMHKVSLKESKTFFDILVETLENKEEKYSLAERVFAINVYKQSIIYSDINNMVKSELISSINLVYSN